MKKILLLIISSSDLKVYDEFRILSRLYHKKMKEIYKDNYNYYFIEHREDILNDYELVDDTLYMKGIESLNEALNKTNKAIQYFLPIIDFNLLIRTNISSFWNIPFVFDYFKNYRNNDLVTGIAYGSFITGTGIFITKDVAEKISTIRDNSTPLEDVKISEYLCNICNREKLPEHFQYFLINGENNVFPEDTSNIMYYRLKSENRLKHDVFAFKKLLNIVYNINVE